MKIPTKTKKEMTTTKIHIIPRVYSEFLVRARKVREKYEIDTKSTLERAIENLEELAEEAHKRATSKNLPTEIRQKWARIEAYIYQTLNSLTKTYDSRQMLEKLEELTICVEELMEEDPEPREED